MLHLGREIFTIIFYLFNHPPCPVLDDLCAEIYIAMTFCKEAISVCISTSVAF